MKVSSSLVPQSPLRAIAPSPLKKLQDRWNANRGEIVLYVACAAAIICVAVAFFAGLTYYAIAFAVIAGACAFGAHEIKKFGPLSNMVGVLRKNAEAFQVENTKYKSENEKHQAENQKQKEENEKLDKHNKTYEANNKKLEASNQALGTHVKNLKGEVTTLTDQNTKLGAHVKDLGGELDTLKTQNKALKDNVVELKDNVGALKDNVGALEESRKQLTSDFEGKITALEESRKKLVTELEGQISSLESSKKQLIADFQGEISSLKENREKLVADFEGKLTALEESRVILVQQFEGQITALNDKNVLLKKTHEALQGTHKEYIETHTKYKKAHEDLIDVHGKLENDHKALHTENGIQRDANIKLTAVASQMESNAESIQGLLASFKEQNRLLIVTAKDLNNAPGEFDKVKQQILKTQEELQKKLTDASTDLHKQIQASQSISRHISDSLQQHDKELATNIGSLNQAIKDLKADDKTPEKLKMLQELQTQSEQEREKLLKAQAEIAQAQLILKQLQESCAHEREQLQGLRTQYQSTLTEYNTTLDAYKKERENLGTASSDISNRVADLNQVANLFQSAASSQQRNPLQLPIDPQSSGNQEGTITLEKEKNPQSHQSQGGQNDSSDIA